MYRTPYTIYHIPCTLHHTPYTIHHTSYTILADWCPPGGPKSREMCVRMLLDNKSDPNMRDFQNFTALHYACMWGWMGCVKVSGVCGNCEMEGYI
ncbi:ankyrin repeat domain-containing protein [archaeon]|nr:MAG: ankyrin repeat domain-containing protein [archaeon]